MDYHFYSSVVNEQKNIYEEINLWTLNVKGVVDLEENPNRTL